MLSGEIWALFEHLLGYQELLTLCALGEIQVGVVQLEFSEQRKNYSFRDGPYS